MRVTRLLPNAEPWAREEEEACTDWGSVSCFSRSGPMPSEVDDSTGSGSGFDSAISQGKVRVAKLGCVGGIG